VSDDRFYFIHIIESIERVLFAQHIDNTVIDKD